MIFLIFQMFVNLQFQSNFNVIKDRSRIDIRRVTIVRVGRHGCVVKAAYILLVIRYSFLCNYLSNNNDDETTRYLLSIENCLTKNARFDRLADLMALRQINYRLVGYSTKNYESLMYVTQRRPLTMLNENMDQNILHNMSIISMLVNV